MSGWIKLHRSLKDNGHLSMPDSTLKIWIWILLTACHDTERLRDIILQPGQLLASYDRLSSELSNGGKAMSKTTISKALKFLEAGSYITVEKRNGKANIITVNNWSKYQLDSSTETVLPNSQTSTESVLVSTKNDAGSTESVLVTCPDSGHIQEDINYIDRWMDKVGLVTPTIYQMLTEWEERLEPALIIEGIDIVAKRRDDKRIKGNISSYLNAILTNWYNKGITTRAELANYEVSATTSKPQKDQKGVVKREYTEDDLCGYTFN